MKKLSGDAVVTDATCATVTIDVRRVAAPLTPVQSLDIRVGCSH